MDIRATADMLAATKIPISDQIVPYLGGIPKYQALGYLVAAIELICGLMVLIGLKARWGALVLIVFTAATIILVHHFWDMSGEAFNSNLTDALKNLSIMGGFCWSSPWEPVRVPSTAAEARHSPHCIALRGN